MLMVALLLPTLRELKDQELVELKFSQGSNPKMNLIGLIECYPDIMAWHNHHLPPKEVYQGQCLFIRGGESNYVTADHKHAIMAQFSHVNAKTITGTGHWLHAQKPVIFNRIVTEFIRKHNRK